MSKKKDRKKLYEKLNKNNPMDLIIERFFRVIGFNITRVLIRTPITANQVTIFRSAFMIAAVFFFTGIYRIYDQYYLNLIAAGILIFIWEALDFADGTLARMRGKASNYGAWLEQVIDRIFGATFGLIGLGITIGIYLQTGSVWPWVVLFFMLYGWDLFIHFTNLEKLAPGITKVSWKEATRKKRQSALGRFVFNIMRFSEMAVMLACFVYYPIMYYLSINILFLTLIAYAVLYNLLWIYLVITQHKHMRNS